MESNTNEKIEDKSFQEQVQPLENGKKRTFGGCLLSIVKTVIAAFVLLLVIGIIFGDDEEESEETAKQQVEANAEEKIEEEPLDITGDIIQDAQNGLLYANDGRIVDSNGRIIDQYSDYTVQETGFIATSDYVVEGLSVDGSKIVFAEPQEVEEKQQELDLNQYADSLVYMLAGEGWQYAKDNKIEMFDFADRKSVLEFTTQNNIDAMSGQQVYVEESTGWFSDAPSYKRTLEETGYHYIGQLNGEQMPDGLGMLLEYDVYNQTMSMKYVGYFKNGTFDGYGIRSGGVFEGYLESIEFYEGYFKEGVKCGDGMAFNTMIDAPDKYSIIVGEYDNDIENGYVKQYKGGKLLYEGEMKDGKYHGSGTLYDNNTGRIIYDGEFKYNEYDGQGTLYDENGDVVYQGKFEGGDIG